MSFPRVRINERIIAPEIRVIDAEGKMIGVMKLGAALELARSQGMDLIEIVPKANPPVAKILSFDKYRYQVEKAEAERRKKQKEIEVKGVRISVRIGTHDLEVKAANVGKFLQRRNKVNIEMRLRGRERANFGYALEVFKKFMTAITQPYTVEQSPKRLGNMINAVIAPK